MGSIGSSLTSTPVTTSGSGANSTGIFTGSSAYSKDFQNVIDRTVAIASLPLNLLTNQQNALTNQSTELGTLDTKFSALQTAIQGVGEALSGSAFEATISNTAVVSATVGDSALQGNYAIKVNSIGAYATSLTTSSWNSGGTPPTSYTLVIGGATHNITPADNSAATVAASINSLYGNQVLASVVNVGPSGAPDYRISLRSASLGPMALDIQKTPGVSLQTQQTIGVLAEYEVNSSGLTVSSNTRSVNIAAGLTVNLLSTSPGPVDVTVTRSTTALNTALSSFTSAYNAAVDEVAKQRGQSGGPLQGLAIVSTLSRALSGISTYNSGGTISGLGALGLDLGSNGHIAYNSFTLLSADFSNSAGVTAFLGSATGGGFLKNATTLMNGLEDPTAGLLKTSQADTKTRSTNIGKQISDRQDRVNRLQISLQNQLSKADALIASMEQQYSTLTNMFAAQDTANQAFSR